MIPVMVRAAMWARRVAEDTGQASQSQETKGRTRHGEDADVDGCDVRHLPGWNSIVLLISTFRA